MLTPASSFQHPPYSVASNMKLPGTYAAHAVIMAIFGQTIAGIHLDSCWSTPSPSAGLFLGKRLFETLPESPPLLRTPRFPSAPSKRNRPRTPPISSPLFALAAHGAANPAPAPRRPAFSTDSLSSESSTASSLCFFGALYLVRHRSSLRTLATFAGAAILPYALTC